MTDIIRHHVSSKLGGGYVQANNIQLVDVKEDYAKLSMIVTDAALNGFGCVHGGIVFGLADTTAGAAAFTDKRDHVTRSGNFHYVGNVTGGVIFAEGHVIHRGKTICVVEVKVYAEDGKLLGDGIYDMFAINKQFP